MEELVTLGLIAGVILLGFIGNFIFKKTNIPNILWLLLFGLLLGQVFNIIDRSFFLEMTGIISSLAIIIILSSGGMELNLKETIKTIPSGFLILIVGMLFSIGTCFFNIDFVWIFMGTCFIYRIDIKWNKRFSSYAYC